MNEGALTSLAKIRVVLARPMDAQNVGSVCRAMKSMGITDLWISGDVAFDAERASIVAVHAADVLDYSRRCGELAEAVDGCSLVAGATRRWGKRRKLARLTPVELADRIASIPGASVAIVFGNEATGLDDAELAVCHLAVTIPSAADARSLNLSHAVQIICYEIFRRFHADSGKRFYTPVSGERLDRSISLIVGSLEGIGLSGESYAEVLRDLLARAAVSRSELERFESLFAKLAGLAGRRE